MRMRLYTDKEGSMKTSKTLIDKLVTFKWAMGTQQHFFIGQFISSNENYWHQE